MIADSSLLDQFLKLPVFFQHFEEHKQRDQNISLFDFLSMHYWGEDMNDQDNDRDMQLPFKKINTHSQQVLFMPPVRISYNQAFVQTLPKDEPAYKSQFHPDPSLPAPFRPPCA